MTRIISSLTHSLRNKLILLFLAVSVIPLAVVGLLAFYQSQDVLREQVSNELTSVRNLKARQIEEYFRLMNEDILLLSKLPIVAGAVQEFVAATRDLYIVRRLGYMGRPNLAFTDKNHPYDDVHARYFEMFKEIVEIRGYDDIYLITPNGDIVYNYDKGDDFATNLARGPYRDTTIASLFRQLQTSTNSDEVKMTDFIPYGPSNGEVASFIGTPIVENGQNIGILVYQLPLDRIDALIQDHTGMGQVGEAYLVGPDMLMRSNSRFSQESTILKQEADTLTVGKALAGQAGVDEVQDYRGISVLSAYQPMQLGQLEWALLVDVDTAEVFAAANRLRDLILTIIGVAAVTVAGLGLVIALSITRPISNLTKVVTAIAEGDLSHTVRVETRDEIGLLARVFNTMTAQLQELIESLEQRVIDRTAKLAQANAEISALNERLKDENLRMTAELNVTRQLQQILLPTEEELGQVKGMDIAGFMEPAEEVGGDYYDVLQHDGRVKIGIGDVTGHGLESGVVMLMTQTAVRTLLTSGERNPERFLNILNRTLYDNIRRMGVDKNLSLTLLDCELGQMKLNASGQHEQLLVVRQGGHVEVVDTLDLGFPLGLEKDITRFVAETSIDLQVGDGIVLYSDGFTEMENEAREFYGLKRLCEVVSKNWAQTAKDIKDAVVTDVRRFAGEQQVYDDLTLLVIKQQ